MTLRDQLKHAIFDDKYGCEDPPYREQRWLLDKGAANPPHISRATATGFSGWIYDLCHARRADRGTALERGKFVERQLYKQRQFARSLGRDYPTQSNLDLLFEDPLDGTAEPLLASKLTIDGQKLRCLPDRVFKNPKTKEVFVFERKSTTFRVPAQGWPNLKVQLWCYAWIDDWIDAPEIYLVGDIRVPKDGSWQPSFPAPHWKRSDPVFNADCSALFELYGGVCSLPRSSSAR